MKRFLIMMLLLSSLFSCTAYAEQPRDASALIADMVVNYGAHGEAADPVNAGLLEELRTADPAAASKWESIMDRWKNVNSDLLVLHEGVLPDGLMKTDALCLVVLGFQLNPDGSMKDELIGRLEVALASAKKYPNALIVCTGGGTASENEAATEAGRMAEWLAANGVDPARVIVEDQSKTTAQNAIFTCKILKEQYPQVWALAIISSDYHIATGTLLFDAESTLLAGEGEEEPFFVVSNAAWPAPSGYLSPMFQAGALIELAGDTETAYKIYLNHYDIHELPPLEK